jgi:hypothetical protein
MQTETKHMDMPMENTHQNWSTSLYHFVRHFIEMCLAMCIGGIPLIILFFWGAAQLGYTDLAQRFPELVVMAVAIILAVVMFAWMRIRHHELRPAAEMAVTTIILAGGLIGLTWVGVLAESSLMDWFTRLACPAMLIPMLLRLDLYTGRACHE